MDLPSRGIKSLAAQAQKLSSMGSHAGTLSSASVLLSSLELSDAQVYEPSIRALLETSPHFSKVVVLELITVPLGTGAKAVVDGLASGDARPQRVHRTPQVPRPFPRTPHQDRGILYSYLSWQRFYLRVETLHSRLNRAPLGPYGRTMPRAPWWSLGGGRFLLSEVPLYC